MKNQLRQAILALIFFVLYIHSAQAMQPCDAGRLTKEQASERYDNIVVVKVKSSQDETDWFLKNQREKYKDEPEELKMLDEDGYLIAYVTYKATILENFKGDLKGEIKLAQVRQPFTSLSGTLVTGFYYILGLDNSSPDDVIVMPDCTAISVGVSKFEGSFIDKVEEYRK